MRLNYALLNFIFPQTEDEKCIAGVTPEVFASKYALHEVRTHMYALASFKDQSVRSAIHLLKFHHNPHAIDLLAALVCPYLQSLPEQKYVLIPMPLSASRERQRGYNQVAVIAHASIKDFPAITLHTDILMKKRHTQPQSSLPRQERLHNIQDAFVLKGSKVPTLSQSHVILLDDVITTGATLREAYKTVARAKPLSLTCVALAH